MLNSKHWSHDGNLLNLFNVWSCVHDKELYIGESPNCLTKAMPHDRAQDALQYLLCKHENNYGYGNPRYVIHYIQVNEYMGHFLFDEKVLSLDMLQIADEDEKNIFVPLVINGRRRIVAIRDDLSEPIVLHTQSGRSL